MNNFQIKQLFKNFFSDMKFNLDFHYTKNIQSLFLKVKKACNEDYNWFTGDQKSRLLKLIPDCDLLDDIVDTPRIEREYMAVRI
jgi:hypothetical protein